MLKDKIRAMVLKKKEEGGKQDVQNLIVFLVILIITIIAVNTIWNGDTRKKNTDNTSKLSDVQIEEVKEEPNYDLEQKLENILKKIQGVGEVEVLITYSETSQLVAMYNENKKETATEEADNGGRHKENNRSRY